MNNVNNVIQMLLEFILNMVNMEKLIVGISNSESHNDKLIEEGKSKEERFEILRRFSY